ncbi:protease pro-enzyme activation domain-containing protein [Spirosoma sp.]|uniref:S53 family peptidase n=1 Tax=Spirosoma sp. TaxID=1899569 RepID=UPI002623D7F2|nr:protease pro-enzyme activation domain-containing protein [Spirosoma sp.]MCX6215518.1 protease pro-enzyme activation domain-containing protein [Spirosoma sp.]
MSAFDQLVPLPGSEKTVPNAAPLQTLDPNEVLTVTIRIRRKRTLASLVSTTAPVTEVMSRSEYASRFGADPAIVRQVEAFATAYDLSLVEQSLARRSVLLRGTVAQMEQAFGVSLANYQLADGSVFRGRTGVISVPSELVEQIEGVFGLDNRPQALAHFQIYKPEKGTKVAPRAGGLSYTPPQLARLYNFPTGVTGKGQCIAIIELGGGFRTADIKTYFGNLGLKPPTVVAVSVDGGHNAPSTADSADGEVMLDIDVAGGVAPGAKIVVYFAPNTDQGFLDAITTAMHDTKNKPSVISISWGAAESNWTPQRSRRSIRPFRRLRLWA